MALVVVEELQDYLISAGVGNHPSADASSVLPRVYLRGRDGAILPKAPETMTVTLSDTLLQPPASLEAFLEEAFIDVIVRSTSAAAGKFLHRTIRDLLHPIGDHGGKKQWQMGDLTVEYSTIWRGEQELPPAGDADVRTYDRVASYRFGVRRTLLT